MHRTSGHLKGAELLSGVGAIVLGAGLGLLAPALMQRYAVTTLAIGVLLHGTGMTLKYRLESRDGPPLWWERLLFWLCWIGQLTLVGRLVHQLAGDL